MKNAIYFWIGLLLGTVNVDKIAEWVNHKAVVASILFITIAGTIVWIFSHQGTTNSMLINTCVLGFSIILLLGIMQIKYNINNRFIDFVSINSFAIYIMHWPILMVIRAVVNYTLHLPPVFCMLIMFFGGLMIASGIAYLLRKMDWPMMKGVRRYVFGM